MDRPGDQFLPRSAFPADQHIALRVSHLAHDVKNFLHRLTLSHDLRERGLTGHFPLEQHVLCGQPALFKCVTNDELDFVYLERLVR